MVRGAAALPGTHTYGNPAPCAARSLSKPGPGDAVGSPTRQGKQCPWANRRTGVEQGWLVAGRRRDAAPGATASIEIRVPKPGERTKRGLRNLRKRRHNARPMHDVHALRHVNGRLRLSLFVGRAEMTADSDSM